MVVAPAERRLVSDSIYRTLREEILSGSIAAGDALPPERALSEQFEVNRHAVREAVKRLQQAGLVNVVQGDGTRVRDWQRSAGLDLLTDLAASAEAPARLNMLRAAAEMRAAIGADAARLCALRSSGRVRGRLAELAATDPPADPDLALLHYEEIWELIVDGADNIAYRLAFNSLVAARFGGGVDSRVYDREIGDADAHRNLIEAIGLRDSDAAEHHARELLARTLSAVESTPEA